MARRKAYVAMDTNSLLRFVYAIATARHKNEQTVKRRVVETKILEILVTDYVLKETRRNIESVIRSANLRKHGWFLPAEEVARRVENELESLIAAGVVVNIEEPRDSGYARALLAVQHRPRRRVLLPFADRLAECLRQNACSKKIEKDIPVAMGFLLAYDVAAVVPLSSRAGVVSPPFVAVTYDVDFLCALHLCLHQLGIAGKILLLRYSEFSRQLYDWLGGSNPTQDMGIVQLCANRCQH